MKKSKLKKIKKRIDRASAQDIVNAALMALHRRTLPEAKLAAIYALEQLNSMLDRQQEEPQDFISDLYR